MLHTKSVPCSWRNCCPWLVKSHQITGPVKPLCFLSEAKVRKGTVVSSHHPRAVSGLYWGYSVRLASCLSEYLQRFSAWPSSLRPTGCTHLFPRISVSDGQLTHAASSHVAVKF